MRIALIRTYQPQLVEDLAQPLGIMALDAYLRERGYDDIHLFDMRLQRETPTQVLDRVLPLAPDVIGLSSLSVEMDAIHQLAGEIKARAPLTHVVVGGPYATSSKRTVLNDPAIDYAVVGEGEITLYELLETIRTEGDVGQVRGIVYRHGSTITETPERPKIADLDALPIPSWDRIDMEAYQRLDYVENFTGGRWAVLYTSRGCPFKCTYCHDVMGKKFRARSPNKVIEEMELLITRYGIRSFQFYDDIFNFDKRRVFEICRLIQSKGWKIDMQFPNGIRADIMDLDVLRALKGAGAYRVTYAIESASPRIQKSVKKNLKIDKVSRLIEHTDEMGLLVHGFFMLGFPGETKEEVLATVDWACRSKLHTAAFFLVSPFEGTPLAETYVSPAKELHGQDFQYYDNPHSMSEVPANELRRIQQLAYVRFYANPRRLLRMLKLLPRKRVLLKFAGIFLKIARGGVKLQGANSRSWRDVARSIETLVASRRPMDVAEAQSPPRLEAVSNTPSEAWTWNQVRAKSAALSGAGAP